MKKVAIFGCKATTIYLIESLKADFDIACVITISPEQGKKAEVADYTDVREYCSTLGIPVYSAKRYDLKSDEDTNALAQLKLDTAFVIGWQRLIPKAVLSNFSIGVFGMHGSTDDLPVGRGRSPMNWALLEGRSHFFTNLFRYDSGVDSGDILDTMAFSLQPNDTAETMHYKNVLSMKALILKNKAVLLSGDLALKKQKDTAPTYYPKRTPADSLLDWRRDIFQIEAFIRAVTRPFNGAFSFVGQHRVRIWRACIFETALVDFGFPDEVAGTVVEVFPGGKFLIACRGGLLLVHEFDAPLAVTKGMVLSSPVEQIKRFETNECGFHDMP